MTEAHLRALVVAWWVPWFLGWITYRWDLRLAPAAVVDLDAALWNTPAGGAIPAYGVYAPWSATGDDSHALPHETARRVHDAR